MEVSAEANKRFGEAPGLKPFKSSRRSRKKSSLKIKLSSTVKDANKNITAYIYKLIYTGKENLSKSNSLKYKLRSEVKSIMNKILGIKRVKCGNKHIDEGGGNRLITIVGDPGTTFKFAFTKEIEDDELDAFVTQDTTTYDLRNVDDPIDIVHTVANDTLTNYLGDLNIINDTIPKSGEYHFKYKFEPATLETKYNLRILPTTISSIFNRDQYELDAVDGKVVGIQKV